MSELFTTDAWVALLEIVGVGGLFTAVGMIAERRWK